MTEKLKELIKQFDEENAIIKRDIAYLNKQVDDIAKEVEDFFVSTFKEYLSVMEEQGIEEIMKNCIIENGLFVSINNRESYTEFIFQAHLDDVCYNFHICKDYSFSYHPFNPVFLRFVLENKEAIRALCEKGIEEKLIERHKNLLEQNKKLLDGLNK